MAPKLSTTGSFAMFIWRLTMCCAEPMISAAAATGSTPPHGREPCVWRPFTVMVKRSEAAISGPGRTPIVPTLSVLKTCRPNMASGLKASNTPCSNM